MKFFYLGLVSFLILVSLSACSKELVTIRMTVVDEEGVPVEDARVSMSFLSGSSYSDVVRYTNGNGVVKASRFSSQETAYSITKGGFYKTKNLLIDGSHDTKAVLKKKKNPIPMFVKNTHLLRGLPTKNNPNWIGYDFEMGDYLPPYGTGVTKDFEFTYVVDRKDIWNFRTDFEIRFPNELDGLAPMKDIDFFSEYWSGYEAPITQYENYKVFYAEGNGVGTPIVTNFERSRKYYFRVRSQVDEAGNLISANYGKLYDELGALFYYFNPNENDRNVEFKVGSNLFGEDADRNKRIFKP